MHNIHDDVVKEPSRTISAPLKFCRGDKSNIPGCRNRGQGSAITTKYEPVRDASVLHRVLAEASGLLHAQTPYEYGRCGNDTKTERKTPNSIEMVIAKAIKGISTKQVRKQTQ